MIQKMRNKSVMGQLKTPKLFDTNIKPLLIESRLGHHEEFFNMTSRFKEVLTDDRQDRNMVLPICGYQGHRRGDRSQNYFGKSFRDVTIQSKHLERQIRSKSPVM